ncbi:MAG: type II secretion system F family protein [Pseudomonadota bacterium]
MTMYAYKGRNRAGEQIDGLLEAEHAEAVADYLIERNIMPLDIVPHVAKVSVIDQLNDMLRPKRVPLVDLIFFTRQMYTLLKAGVPIIQALQGLRESTPSEVLARVIGEIRDSLDAGDSLSIALNKHREVFSTLYVSLIEVGEASGTLVESFGKLSSYLELERETRSRIKSALRYPMIVVGVIVIAMFVINLFVIPAFAKVFDRFQADLPLPTQILIGVSQFTQHYWYLMILAMIGIVHALRRYVATEQGRMNWDRYKLKIPAIGAVLHRATLGRFALAMSISIRSGVHWRQAMTVVSHAVDNVYVGQLIIRMRDEVERGSTIAHAAMLTGQFPSMVLQMISVGEQTGSLDELLNEVAEYYEREVDYKLKNLSAAIEPLLLAFVGGMVLILALGVFLPMWDLGKAAMAK